MENDIRPSGRPKLLLLHGFLSGGMAWGPLRRELGGDVDTVAPDLLGYGQASRPVGPYTLESVVAHLLPLVLAERPTHVVGHSMGGLVALALARELPGQFARVGVVGLPVFRDRADGLALLLRRGIGHKLMVQRDPFAHAVCIALRRFQPAWQRSFRPILERRHPPEAISPLFEHSRATHRGGLETIVFAGLAPALAAAAPVPVAALHGARDRTAPASRVRALGGRLGWDVDIVRGAGHQVTVEQPAIVAEWLRARVLMREAPAAAPRP